MWLDTSKLPKGIDVAQARASRPVDEEKVKGLITRHGAGLLFRVVFRTKMTGEVLKFFGIWSLRNTVDMKTHLTWWWRVDTTQHLRFFSRFLKYFCDETAELLDAHLFRSKQHSITKIPKWPGRLPKIAASESQSEFRIDQFYVIIHPPRFGGKSFVPMLRSLVHRRTSSFEEVNTVTWDERSIVTARTQHWLLSFSCGMWLDWIWKTAT